MHRVNLLDSEAAHVYVPALGVFMVPVRDAKGFRRRWTAEEVKTAEKRAKRYAYLWETR